MSNAPVGVETTLVVERDLKRIVFLAPGAA
jgi:hypothetical protein